MLAACLDRARKETQAQAALFDGDMNAPAQTVAAANRLDTGRPTVHRARTYF
ncbi:MAG: hypothetical protein R3C16_03620 [Hyphomonadaceae bacterium]